MEVGVEVWLKDTQGDKSWIAGFVHAKEYAADGKLNVIVRTDEGQDFKYSVADDNQEIDDLKLRNDVSESEVENLINLPYLHEPAILFCLEQRYSKSDIYTYTGPILIAMNPFKRVPLYTNQILEVYYNSGLLKSQGIEGGTTLSPHVYAIADSAYREMMKSIMVSGFGASTKAAGASLGSANHSILISGESGAGKTESTKIVLRYLTTVGNSSGGLDMQTGSVMDKVLQSNPILEAFGNAKTLRNDNSSRFGKFIELNFNKRGHLIGSRIKTYLLEKVRLPSQQRGERNFHVFYQLAAGATAEEKERWQLRPAEEFLYTAQGGVFRLKDMDDAEGLQELRDGLRTLNFDADDQRSLFDIVSGLLHMGQLEFQSVFDAEGEGSALVDNADCATSLSIVAQLCGLLGADVLRTLTVRTIVAREETYEKKLTPTQASDARDAVAKSIYGRLFDWIVYTINLSIQVDPKLVRANIGVLDIFGFECFVHNSFEQLCINYTNETLQQQFNQYIFKLEQVEYAAERIEWSFIEFPDNQDCLDLIEHRLTGILAMIDDECRLPKASDEKLASRMYKALESHSRFTASAAQRRDHKFCIKHYAGPVVYSTITFVEKNKDELPKEATALLAGSSVPLLAQLFSAFGGPAAGASADKLSYSPGGQEAQSRRPSTVAAKPVVKAASAAIASLSSVATQFKGQLVDLMDSIRATTPHYIRCLKPNDQNISDNFNRLRITEQLRYGGVLEAVRVARSGFPVRLTHQDFFARYRSLASPYSPATAQLPASVSSKHHMQMLKELCDLLLQALWDESVPSEPAVESSNDKRAGAVGRMTRRQSKLDDLALWRGRSSIARESVQMGLTKVFLRKAAHDVLESRRSRRIVSAVRRIQSIFRCHRICAWYRRVLCAVRLIQRVGRGLQARAMANGIRRQHAALVMQKQARRYVAQRAFRRMVSAVQSLQMRHRCKKSQRLVTEIRKNVRALTLQRFCRGWLCRLRFGRMRRAVVALQCRVRRIIAKIRLKAVRAAAKDVGKLQQSNDALKHEIEALKARAAEETRRLRADLERQMEAKAALALEDELGSLRNQLAAANAELVQERALRAEAVRAVSAMERAQLEAEQELGALLRSMAECETALTVEDFLLLRGGAAPAAKPVLAASAASPKPDLRRSATSPPTIRLQEKATSPVTSVTSPPTSPSAILHRKSTSPSAASPASSSTHRVSTLESPVPNASAEMSAAAAAAAEERYREAIDALEKEAYARQVLEDEVTRLRALSMEYKAQVDSLRRTTLPPPPPTSNPPASVSTQGASLRRLSTNPAGADPTRRRTSVGAVAPIVVQKAAEEPAQWGRAWDAEENDGSSTGDSAVVSPRSSISDGASVQGGNQLVSPNSSSGFDPSRHAPAVNAEVSSAVTTFERNLEGFRSKLKLGVKAQFWEGQRISNVEIQLKLDPSGRLVVFEAAQSRRGAFALFQSRIEIAPVGLSDIVECLPGAEVKSEGTSSGDAQAEQATLLTIVTKMDQRGTSRILGVKLASRDQRNTILSGLRTLVADLHVHPTSGSKQASRNSTTSLASAKAGTVAPAGATRRPSQLSGAGSSSSGSSVVPSTSNPLSSAAVNQSRPAPARRLSVREVAQEEKLQQQQSAVPTKRLSVTGATANQNEVAQQQAAAAAAEENAKAAILALRRQLADEKERQERMTIQVLILTNDLTERDETIAQLKRREEQFERTLVDRDNMFKQDAMVRMQLGKRLEQVLMDKEEALEQLELMREQVDSIKESFASMGAAAPAGAFGSGGKR